MIKFRLKERVFVDREDRWKYIDPFPEITKFKRLGKEIYVELTEKPTYTQDFNKYHKNNPVSKKRIKSLRKELKRGFLYDNGQPDSNTHWIGEEKDRYKFHYMCKDINSQDRFSYLINKPRIITDELTGEDVLFVEVDLKYCYGHRDLKTGKLLSEHEE